MPTEHRSTFSRRDVLQAVAERLPDGASVARVQELADSVLEHGSERLVVLEPRRGQLAAVGPASQRRGSQGRPPDDARLTTRGLLLVEQGAVRSALARGDEHIAVVPEAVVEAVLAARGPLSDEHSRPRSRTPAQDRRSSRDRCW